MAKINKGDITAHRRIVNVLTSNITFFDF